MPLHYFHCTNGIDLVLDRRGKRISPQQIERVAAHVAGSLMTGLPELADWSDWLVNVYNADGSVVAILPFCEVTA